MSLQSQPPSFATDTARGGVLGDRQLWRILLVTLLIGVATLFIAVRLLQYQLLEWATLGPDRLQRSGIGGPGLAPRGVIVDRDGVLLAADRFLYRVETVPTRILPAKWPGLAARLEQIAQIPIAQTLTRLQAHADQAYARLADNLPMAAGQALLAAQQAEREEALPAEERLLDQLMVRAIPSRYYPQAEQASHLLGFVNMDRFGNYGVEGYYDRFLRADGVGLPRGSWEALQVLPPEVQRFVPSATGKDLVLTVDRTIQWIIEEELRDGDAFYGATAGTIIVMDPRTGAVLAMASTPTYDPNRYSNFSFSILRDPAISDHYEPGSIFKIITMSAAVDSGTVEPSTLFTDTGTIAVGGRIIRNSGRNAAGVVSVTDALALSLNVVTAEIAVRTGASHFYHYINLFGFGQATQIDLFGEVDGIVKAPGKLDWSLSDLGTNSFGQGLAVTPIQMISATCAIINGGLLVRPYVVDARVEGNQVLRTHPTVIRRVLSPQTSATMRQMMVDTVEIGNSKAKVSGYTVGGKSGTAQIPTDQGYTEDDTIVSFVGFGPVEDPQFVILVKMDRPDAEISPWASSTAAPLFSRVARRLFDHLNIPPDAIRLGQG